jgi:hypothetical protein
MKYGILIILLITFIAADEIEKSVLSEYKEDLNTDLQETIGINLNDFTSENGVFRNPFFKQYFKFLENYKSKTSNDGSQLPSNEFKTMFLQNDSCAVVYNQNDFNGSQMDICGTNTNVNMEVRSIRRVPDNKFLYMFEKENCRGRAWKAVTIDHQFDTVSNSAFNARSHMLVDKQGPSENCIWFYDKPCFQGNKREFCDDLFNMQMFGLEGLVGSFRISSNTKGVTIFDELYFEGKAKTFYWSSYGTGDAFNKFVRSMRFKKY